jgi:multicomponent Na+:H+ antiporter subunit D
VSALLPLFVAVPVLSAVLVVATQRRIVRRAVGIVVPAAVSVAGIALVIATRDGQVVVAQVGGWPGGIAITFVADLLSALMLVVSGVLIVASIVFCYATDQDDDPWFISMALVMSAGVYGAYLTADLFNLFVMVEVALLPSYVLFTRRGSSVALRATRLYLTVSLSASTLFLIGLGLVYGVAGTVNIAALEGAGAVPTVAVSVAVILIALAVKSALFPVHSWLPATYPHASPAVTALFSGLLTKIGIYAIIRIIAVVYEPGPVLTAVVVTITLASMVIGVLGALGEQTMRGVLSFHMVSQMGYILVGVVLAGPIGMAAAVFYLVHHTIVKTSLFLTAGAVEDRMGTGRISRLGGIADSHRWTAIAFFLGALSLVGIPPLSGFWAKLGVLTAAVDAQSYLVFGVALLVSIGTLMSMLKLGTGVFWGQPHEELPDQSTGAIAVRARTRWGVGLVLPGLALAGVSLAIGVFPETLIALAETAGASLSDPAAYVEGVLAP